MKYFIILLIVTLNFSLFSKGKELVPDYFITKSFEDKTLKKTEALFVITFYAKKNKLIKKEIVFSYFRDNKKQETDANGQISFRVKPGKYLLKFFYDPGHDEVTTDSILIKPGYRTEVEVDFRSNTEPVIMKKPVIYVYGKQKENVNIKLDLKGEFLFTYPNYSNGWNFTSNPDGTIEINDKKYHYLFWDAKINIEPASLNLNEGFVVDKKDLVSFFENKLQLMGLNSQETEDFITYWCPIMQINEKNFVHFMFNQEYNKYAAMSIDPKPDHLFRVNMLWSKANDVPIKEQKLESFKRSGFTIVEWGGTEISNLTHAQEL